MTQQWKNLVDAKKTARKIRCICDYTRQARGTVSVWVDWVSTNLCLLRWSWTRKSGIVRRKWVWHERRAPMIARDD